MTFRTFRCCFSPPNFHNNYWCLYFEALFRCFWLVKPPVEASSGGIMSGGRVLTSNSSKLERDGLRKSTNFSQEQIRPDFPHLHRFFILSLWTAPYNSVGLLVAPHVSLHLGMQCGPMDCDPYTFNYNFGWFLKRQDSKVMANRLGISHGDHVLGVNMNALLLQIGNGNVSVPLAPFMKAPLWTLWVHVHQNASSLELQQLQVPYKIFAVTLLQDICPREGLSAPSPGPNHVIWGIAMGFDPPSHWAPPRQAWHLVPNSLDL